MPPLADLQARVRDAVVNGETAFMASLLVSPGDPERRMAIHHRHYEASLVGALVERFPATIWLLGSEPVIEAARMFVRRQPPSKPCVAEYGDRFPAFLAATQKRWRYVREFATLEWHVGRLSLAVDEPALSDLSTLDPDHIADATLRLQDGVQYTRLDWPLDELLAFYLHDTAPDDYSLAPETIWLELRGDRGAVAKNRLTAGAFVFREALTRGATLGDAAVAALATDPAFNPTEGLLALLHERLVLGAATVRTEGGL